MEDGILDECMIYTTYFARLRTLPKYIVPVSISLWPPKGWNGLSYTKLSPTRSMLLDYRDSQDWDTYADRFRNEVLNSLDPHYVVEELAAMTNAEKFALVCFEKDFTKCHRLLVAKWLSSAGILTREY